MLEKIKRRIKAFSVSKGYYKSLLYKTSYIDWYLSDRNRLKKFNDIHTGEDCFIIGNGPSLNKMDLSFLKDYYTFGLNKIHLFQKYNLDISYLVSVNPHVINQTIDQFELSKIPTFISLQNSDNYIPKNKNIYKIDSQSEFGFGQKMEDQMFEGGTVTYVAMQIAFAMGFKRIALIGLDHSFEQKGKPNSEETLIEDDINHFDPNYFKGQKWHLADIEANEISYQLANYYFERNDKEIYDATVEGKLNVFEKKDFIDILNLFNRK
jgi:hypothetical protein